MVRHIREAAALVAAAQGEQAPLDRARLLASARQAAARARTDQIWIVASREWMQENIKAAVFAKCMKRPPRGGGQPETTVEDVLSLADGGVMPRCRSCRAEMRFDHGKGEWACPAGCGRASRKEA